MTSPIFTPADPIQDRSRLLDLNTEYMTWNSVEVEKAMGIKIADLVGMPIPDYVASVIDKVCGAPPPEGIFYLVECEGQLAAMGGMRRVRKGFCELKRVYVRPAFRGRQLGQTIIQRLLDDAVAFGYDHALLDSAPFMASAHRLYRAAGFTDCAAYPEAEVPVALHRGWCFMGRAL
ncbi:MAG: GNAT family N-acetyltransferase [Rhodoferax sp.]